MFHNKLHLSRFQQSQSTTDLKNHYRLVNEFAATGQKVLKLGRGYFDWQFFRRPRQLEEQLARDVYQLQGYLSPLGEPDSRQILLAYEKNFGNYNIENVAFSAGVLSTFSRVSELIRTPHGQELLIATPNYPQLEEDALRHGPVKLIAAKRENGYNLTASEIEASLSHNTAGVVLLNPNVVGAYNDTKELGSLINLVERNNIFLILDETNDTIQWQKGGLKIRDSGRPTVLRQHYPGNIDSMCVIRLRSFSKGDMLAEYRIGYVVAMPEVIAALEQSVGANTPPSAATEAVKWLASTYAIWADESKSSPAPKVDESERAYIKELRINASFMDALRCYVQDEVLKVKGAEVIPPQNGFNLFFRIEGYESWQLFEKLLYDCQFAVNPGTCFGLPNESGLVRFTLANAPDKVEEAMKSLIQAFPSKAGHSRFKFSEIEKIRTWSHSRTNLKGFLPESECILS